jgi:hypothetical protein
MIELMIAEIDWNDPKSIDEGIKRYTEENK